MTLDIKPNCKGSVEITDPTILAKVSEIYGEPVRGIDIDFVGELYRIPGRIFTSDPADAYPEEYEDERRAIKIQLWITRGCMLGDHWATLDLDGVIGEQVELLCDAYIYGAEVD